VSGDSGRFMLDGRHAQVVEQIAALLDGTVTVDDVASRLAGFSRSSIASLLDLLIEHGVVEEVGGETRAPGTPLAAARIALVGLEPWGLLAGATLAASGVGELHALDDREIVPADASSLGDSRGELLGSRRSEAFARMLGRRFPSSRVVPGAVELTRNGEIALPPERFDLVIVAGAADDFDLLLGVARAAQRLGLRSMSASLQGTDAVVGPGVAPGSTACWQCYHYRRLAAVESPWAADALDRAFHQGERAAAPPACPPAAAALLGSLIALEAVKLLDPASVSRLLGRVLIQDLASLETSWHRLVQLPWCDVCGGAAGSAAWGGSDPRYDAVAQQGGNPDDRLSDEGTPAQVRDRLAGWVDNHVGVVRSLTIDHPLPGEPALPLTATATLSWWADPAQGIDTAGGSGMSAGAAMVGAVGEAIERYSASRVRPADLVWARLDELPPEGRFDPRDLGLYDRDQYGRPGFAYAPFDPDRSLWWAPGWWVPSWQPAWLPALSTHVGLPIPAADDFVQVTSNGLAAGVSAAAAARKAAFELIERDALMIHWLARRPGRELALDRCLGADVLEVARQLEACGARLRLTMLSAGVRVPVVACVGFGDGVRWPAVTLSASSGPDLVAAAKGAVLEHGHVGPSLSRAFRRGGVVPSSPEAVRTPRDHALLFAPPGRSDDVEFLFDPTEAPIPVAELVEAPVSTVEECGRRLAEAGVSLAVADVTSPDVRSSGWRVARALGAGAQSIHFGWGLERRANPRLARWLQGPMNPLPHPLA
jgi:ribosomal protein S12 methylthiotransferase accessory factor